MCENKEEVKVIPAKKKEVVETTDVKKLQNDLKLANAKIVELTKIVESMKGQYGQLEQVLNNEKIKNQATKDYILDAVKHLYISVTMATKSGV